MRRKIWWGIIPLAALAFQSPARAGAPAVIVQDFSVSFIDSSMCGIPIELSFAGTFTLREFFDRDGGIAAIEFHAPDVATATSSEGRSITGHEVINDRVDFTKGGSESKTGVPLHFNGVLIDAGRVFFGSDGSVAIRGVHQFIEGDLEAFCAALS